jgi:hypothetical protein
MKMFLGNTPMKSLNIKHFEMDTNDCTMVSSDLQVGVTAVARGQKITGTGKAFSFAFYGDIPTNLPWFIPSDFNVIEIACTEYPIQHIIPFKDMKNTDFSTNQIVAKIIIDNNSYELIVSFADNMLNINCDQFITLQVFCGKDEYI